MRFFSFKIMLGLFVYFLTISPSDKVAEFVAPFPPTNGVWLLGVLFPNPPCRFGREAAGGLLAGRFGGLCRAGAEIAPGQRGERAKKHREETVLPRVFVRSPNLRASCDIKRSVTSNSLLSFHRLLMLIRHEDLAALFHFLRL